MPFTYGDGVLQLKNSGDDADAAIVLEGREVPLLLVRHDQPLKEAGRAPLSETDIAIGRRAAALIPDGATLQIGIGNIPTAVLSQLGDHKDLGVHSEMFTDDVIPLVEKGVLNGRLKKTDPGKLVAMFLKGNQPLYDFVDHNEQVLMKDVGYTNSPMVIAQNPRVVALNSAIEIDLSGQVCSDSIGSKVFSGSGGQLDFILGATYSNGGVPIIAMPSLTGKGKSKIVPTLTPGAGVVTPRTLTQWVVTEHGAVNLYGKSLRERARLLISIADPSQREQLERAFNNM
jgi:acyl-CoA hydrolase